MENFVQINDIESRFVVPYEGLHHLQMWCEVRQRQHRTRLNCVQLLRQVSGRIPGTRGDEEQLRWSLKVSMVL